MIFRLVCKSYTSGMWNVFFEVVVLAENLVMSTKCLFECFGLSVIHLVDLSLNVTFMYMNVLGTCFNIKPHLLQLLCKKCRVLI